VSGALSEVRPAVAMAAHPVVVSHIRPDGDAVGSLLAVSESLRAAGKEVTAVLNGGVPGSLKFLAGAGQVQNALPAACDLLICVDCSDLDRTGFAPTKLPRPVDVNIDHHPTNTQFGRFNLVAPEAAATTQILHTWLPEIGLPLTPAVIAALMTGLVTDTIGFRTSSVTPACLRTAASLLEAGAPLAEIYEHALTSTSFAAARYWGAGLSRLAREDGLVWASLTLDDRRQVGYSGSDDADLVNVLTTIEDAQVVVVFVEQSANQVKISWRSRPGIDVSQLATQFGGGGHALAAGAQLGCNLEQAQAQVLEATRLALHPSPV
jgi:bifunctional oligoribonuclease and PAP phosphatase NrnA